MTFSNAKNTFENEYVRSAMTHQKTPPYISTFDFWKIDSPFWVPRLLTLLVCFILSLSAFLLYAERIGVGKYKVILLFPCISFSKLTNS